MNGGTAVATWWRRAERLAALIATIALLGAAPALAQGRDAPISAFFGQWVGSGVSESAISIVFPYTQRDLNVTIRPDGAGFAVSWVTVQRKKGDPNNPTPVRKTTRTSFIPSGRANVWRASDTADPLAGNAYTWARKEGQSLIVYSTLIEDDGRFELQVYTRTLSGLGMALEFVSVRDGEIARTVKGQLTKFSD